MFLNLSCTNLDNYKSNSQKIRILSENWVNENIYCPNCGKNVINYENNKPVADFYCSTCKEDFELKSKNGKSFGKTIADGAYDSMIARITSDSNPNFFFLNYDKANYKINNFIAVPNYLFVPSMILKRGKGLQNRPNYFMCNIDISNIPHTGKIFFVKEGKKAKKEDVLESWHKTIFLKEYNNMKERGWLLDILMCIEKIGKNIFSLQELYQFEIHLKIKHPNNNNIQAKIRQQLQILRDKDYLSFENRGKYKIR